MGRVISGVIDLAIAYFISSNRSSFFSLGRYWYRLLQKIVGCEIKLIEEVKEMEFEPGDIVMISISLFLKYSSIQRWIN